MTTPDFCPRNPDGFHRWGTGRDRNECADCDAPRPVDERARQVLDQLAALDAAADAAPPDPNASPGARQVYDAFDQLGSHDILAHHPWGRVLLDRWVDTPHATHQVPEWVVGEQCRGCSLPATHKVGDQSAPPGIHELTAYLCCGCMAIVGMPCRAYWRRTTDGV
jgi:hypothetical protein